jgi:hypothetical protein
MKFNEETTLGQMEILTHPRGTAQTLGHLLLMTPLMLHGARRLP